jgi:MFS transporter, DHA3 family, macrolide efflux protein
MKRVRVSRHFLIAWAGQLVSNLGSRLSSFALGLWILRATGSTTQFAVTFIITTIPVILASPFAGAFADRWDRRRIMMLCDALAAVFTILLTVLSAAGHLVVWDIYLVAGLTALLDCFRTPAFSASIPLIVTGGQLPRANGMVQTGGAAAAIIGPPLAGVLVNSISMHGVLLIDALTFVVGVVTMALVAIPRPLTDTAKNSAGFWQEAVTGWRHVRRRVALLGLLGLYVFDHFVFAVASVLIVPLLLTFSTPAMVGSQYALSSCGLLLGGVALTAWGGPRKQINGVLLFSFFGGLCLAAHGLRPSFALVAAAGFVLFVLLAVIEASNASLWQTKVPSELQGRCFAVQQLFLNVAMAVGYCVAGPLSDHVFAPLLNEGGLLAGSVGLCIGVGPGRGIGLMFIILGALMSLVALGAYSLPAIRTLDEWQSVLSPQRESAVADSMYLSSGVIPDAQADVNAWLE